MFWTTVLNFVFMLLPTVLVMLYFHKSEVEVAGPYLAFAVPVPVFVLLATWLRVLEDRGWSPRQLALGWSLMMFLFSLVGGVATFYSAIRLRFVSPEGVRALAVVCVFLPFIAPFTIYRRVLKVAAMRAAKRSDGARVNLPPHIE